MIKLIRVHSGQRKSYSRQYPKYTGLLRDVLRDGDCILRRQSVNADEMSFMILYDEDGQRTVSAANLIARMVLEYLVKKGETQHSDAPYVSKLGLLPTLKVVDAT